MPKITFRDKDYNSLADMPAQVRHDYLKSRAGYDVPEEESKRKAGSMPRGLENMPDEVREIYERVRGDLDASPIKASTEDLYRRSAPEGMQNQPSDEVIYQPSPPIIEPPDPIIESDHTLRGLVLGLGLAILLVGIFLVLYLSG